MNKPMEYPNLFSAAERSSETAQRSYSQWLTFYLTVLVLGALFDAYSGNPISDNLSAGLFFLSLATAVWLAFAKYEQHWYNSRAIAESVKTLAWKFSMRTTPFGDTNLDAANGTFLGQLRNILDDNKETLGEFDFEAAAVSIPESMLSIRALDLEQRKSYYLAHRVSDQARWYGDKAKRNKNMRKRWFRAMVGLHAFAFFFVLVKVSGSKLNLPVSTFAVAGGAALAWIQINRFGDLAASYALTAFEITHISASAPTVRTEPEFNKFVEESEKAFSREHTQWVARRST